MNWSYLRGQPMFLSGLVARVLLIALVSPWVQREWFVPFIEHFAQSPSIDPWGSFLGSGGGPRSFPYGPVMLAVYAPAVMLGQWVDDWFGLEQAARIGFGLTTLVVDLGILHVMGRLFPHASAKVLLLYWLSPITLFVGYWYGQTDLVPVFLLMAAFLALEHTRTGYSGVLLGMAAAAKLSMVIAIPFFLIYLGHNRRMHAVAPALVLGLALSFGLLQLPFLGFSEGFRVMLLENPEVSKIYFLSIKLGDSVQIYLVPLAYLTALYATWRLGRMNMSLLSSSIGAGFLVILLLTPASVGWFFWALPFLVAHQIQSGSRAVLLMGVYGGLFLGFALMSSPGVSLPQLGLDLDQFSSLLSDAIPDRARSIWQTSLTAVGVVLLWRIFREGIVRNDYFRLSRRPLAIGIAGDSGSGKDTLSLALARVFGENSVVSISGDDYHKWDRYAPMWKYLTHLNERANDLLGFFQDVKALVAGQSIRCHTYDHKTGRFTPVTATKRNDVVIASGLHALYFPDLASVYDVCVYLDMSEELRRHFKIERDVHQRGHSKEAVLSSIERRHQDSERFVRPQMEHADLVLRLEPVNPNELEDVSRDTKQQLNLKLRVVFRNSPYYEQLLRVLIGICGMRIDVTSVETSGSVELLAEGEVQPEDIEMAIGILVPRMEEMLSLTPQWKGGMTGLMQLLVLTHAAHVLHSRN